MGKHHRRTVALIPIASPLAGHRLTKKIGSLITKCAENKNLVYGVKDTAKTLRKHEKGICVLGGDVTPMDVITHIPGICDENQTPYVFFAQKQQISAYAHRTSPVACVVIREPKEDDTYAEDYNQVLSEIQALNQPEAPEEQQ